MRDVDYIIFRFSQVYLLFLVQIGSQMIVVSTIFIIIIIIKSPPDSKMWYQQHFTKLEKQVALRVGWNRVMIANPYSVVAEVAMEMRLTNG